MTCQSCVAKSVFDAVVKSFHGAEDEIPMNEMLLALAIALQIGDGVTTFLALQKHGVMEWNRMMRRLFGRLGVVQGLVLAKSFGMAVCWVAYVYAGPFAVYTLGFIVVLYAVVVINNLKSLRR